MPARKKTTAAKKAAGPATTLDHGPVFAALRGMFADVLPKLQALVDNDKEYTLHTRVASPYKQHKGAPMYFGTVREGKAYVSFHLFPLYINPALKAAISPELMKRMQGKTCFHFKEVPSPAMLAELKTLSAAGLRDFEHRDLA